MADDVLPRDTIATVENSVRSILRHQEENGAIVASPDFEQYHFCWLRDGSFCAYALDVAGQYEASARYHSWVVKAVSGIASLIDDVIATHERGELLDPAFMPPARFALDGSTVIDDWPNFQIDGYGTWLWSLGQHFALTGVASVPEEFLESVTRVARYLSAFVLSPCYDVWEENGEDVHTSTLACVYGGLVAAGRLLDNTHYEVVAESIRTRLRGAAARGGYFIKSSASEEVDGSLLWLSTPFRVVELKDREFARTVALIEEQLKFEGGVRRYGADVYFGSGSWPVLTGSLGWYYVASGDLGRAIQYRDWIATHFDTEGRLGEQFGGERRDPQHYQEWVARWGPPARDLTWSHAMYVILSQAIEEAGH